jgi:hypothetical protein
VPPATMEAGVVGVSFVPADHVATVQQGEHVTLLPEPDNAHDPNAVAVYRWVDHQLAKVGHLPAGLAARVDLPTYGTVATVTNLRFHNSTVRGFDVELEYRHLRPRHDAKPSDYQAAA